MNITQLGRVELDPNKVPIPASTRSAAEPSFEERLETVARRRAEEPTPGPEAPARQESERAEGEAVEASTAPRDPDETSATEAAPAERPQSLTSRAAAEPSVASELKPMHGQLGSSRTGEVRNPNQTAAIEPVPSSAQGLTDSEARSVAPALASSPTPVAHRAGQAQAQPNAMVERANAHKELFKTTSTQPGYRTLNKATMQMAEAARDSVFRQIALRMNGAGGEMRVLLDPPELGKLNLHMVVEKGGTVHLSLIAERPELATMLDKHLGELKQALEAHGLSIGNTEVRGQEKQLQDHERWGDSSSSDTQPDEGDDWTAAAFRRAGYITAEGLDFWV